MAHRISRTNLKFVMCCDHCGDVCMSLEGKKGDAEIQDQIYSGYQKVYSTRFIDGLAKVFCPTCFEMGRGV